MPGLPVSGMRTIKASPLVGEVGGGRPASAGHKNPLPACSSAAAAEDAPPTQPSPTRGEGFRRLRLAPDAIPRARALRKRMTDAERALWRALREALPDLHWRKQVPFGPYTADFCSHRAKLMIEVDGGQHATQASQASDAARARFLESQGYRVLRVWNHDVLGNTEGVIAHVAAALRVDLVP